MTKLGISWKIICAALCAVLVLSGCESRVDNASREDSESIPEQSALPTGEPNVDFAAIMGAEGADVLPVNRELAVTRPSEDITLNAETYYITGTSDPDVPLLLGGEPVAGRGVLGSFGVFAELAEGVNEFVFTQGEASVTVTITRGEGDGEVPTTNTITKPQPEVDEIVRAGTVFTLKCVAPSGGAVTAEIGGETLELAQLSATAVAGVPATFALEYTPKEAAGISELGLVQYSMTFGDLTATVPSEGKLFSIGENDELMVRTKEISATTFVEESEDSDYFTTIKRGATDKVEEIGDAMYRLSTGGWVNKDAMEPVTEPVNLNNVISAADYAVGEQETLALTATAAPPYQATWDSGQLALTFFRTSGLEKVDVGGSNLFSEAAVTEANGTTTITFTQNNPDSLWGYVVEYGDGKIMITCTGKPRPTGGDRPLTGLTIALDPGHGGDDPGAIGVAREDGPTEMEINMATAVATEKYLRELGATVLLTRKPGEGRVDLAPRMEQIQNERVDLMISLHCNSFSYSMDGTGPSGVEIYYYEQASKALAQSLQDAICAGTGRKNRDIKHSNYRITLISYAPSVMVEMGFLTNPVEYDNMRSAEGIYSMASAIGQGVVNLFAE